MAIGLASFLFPIEISLPNLFVKEIKDICFIWGLSQFIDDRSRRIGERRKFIFLKDFFIFILGWGFLREGIAPSSRRVAAVRLSFF